MKYLLDTNVLIDFFHGEKATIRKVQLIEKEEKTVSVITVAEIYHGSHKTSNPKKHIAEFESFLKDFSIAVILIDRDIAKKYGEVMASLERKGQKISGFDVLLAATAQTYNLIVITNDKALRNVGELKIDTP